MSRFLLKLTVVTVCTLVGGVSQAQMDVTKMSLEAIELQLPVASARLKLETSLTDFTRMQRIHLQEKKRLKVLQDAENKGGWLAKTVGGVAVLAVICLGIYGSQGASHRHIG